MASSQPRQYPRYRKSGPPSRRDQQSSQKRRHYAGHHRKRGRPPLPVLVLPHAEEERDLEAHPEPQTSQQEVHPTGEVQDGDSHINPPPTAPRDVGILRRSKGCLPTYPHPTRGPAVPRVQVQGHRLPLHSATIWPLHGTQGFHQGNKGGPGSPPPKRGNGVRLPRRLVSTRQLPTRGSRQYKRHRLPPDETGVVNQCREIQPRAHSIDHILRGPSRPPGHGLPDGRKNGKPSGHGQKNTRQSEYPSAHVAAPLGKMASFTDLLDLCRLRMRPLQRHLLKHYAPDRSSAATPIPLPTGLRPFLTWWAESDRIAAGRPFRNPAPTTSITTDASLSGGERYGAHTQLPANGRSPRGVSISIF
ncbi:putative TBC1 domain family member 2A [Apostichopus japonicus]|uniref:Putative TBC1 domain family member 2A n=1 Tax=Stichopus japonicus TaxID=307972 RepID=A0A2G8K721_STIJA|nr:putative TBC1 domain family member 2A [Apostichopus japonicus]